MSDGDKGTTAQSSNLRLRRPRCSDAQIPRCWANSKPPYIHGFISLDFCASVMVGTECMMAESPN
jgi:hypothetical protein